MKEEVLEQATLGAGCFWCIEAIFDAIEGVSKVVPGYSGGHIKNPAYREVCAGRTGHAEVAQITFDPKVIGFDQLLTVFFATHDPTTLNRQGADVGTQYRSVIFYHSTSQKKVAELAIVAATESREWKDGIVTEIAPFEHFYMAEKDHHDYYLNNPEQGYCRVVVKPKLDKFKSRFSELLKK